MRTRCFRKRIVPKTKMKFRRRQKARIRALNNSFLIQELPYMAYENDSNSKSVFENCNKFNVNELNQKDVSLYPICIQNNKKSDENLLNKTIDLTTDENSIHCIQEVCEVKEKDCIDLCDEKTDQNEVVILAENTNQAHKRGEKRKITICDITDDDKNNSNMANQSNDDILLLGTFEKIPLSNSKVRKQESIICWHKNKNKLKKKTNFKHNKNCNRKLKYLTQEYYQNVQQPPPRSAIGGNVYYNSDINLPKSGLRPIIIDGSNVAMINKKGRQFSCRRLQICINYFKEGGHDVTAFVPQFRTQQNKSDNPELLKKMVRDGDVILTPSKEVEGISIVPYDDRFIVQTAVLKGGIIVTRDNYRDLLEENPAWAETINFRTLPYTWVGDVLMFPKDPLGEHGPSLEEFLKFH